MTGHNRMACGNAEAISCVVFRAFHQHAHAVDAVVLSLPLLFRGIMEVGA